MKSKNKSGQFWEYAGMIIALLVMVSVGVWFVNQPEIEEVPAETQRTVMSEKPEQENKQEEKTVLNDEPKKEKLVASSYVKEKTVTGTITDSDFGEPIPWVSILVVSSNEVVKADVNGNYSLKVKEGGKIIFSYDGFEPVTITVSEEKDIIDVVMFEETSVELENLIVDKYRTVSRKTTGCGGIKTYKTKAIEGDPNETSSVSITPEMICRFGYKDIHSRLKEMMISNKFVDYAVGLDIPPIEETTRTPETILKDVEILTRNQEFTYIVDGVRVSEETFRSLNPNDIESIDIYKHTDVTNARFGKKDNQSRIGLRNR